MKSRLEKGDKVVLSPGAASFELFTNEFYRGNQFKQKVREMLYNDNIRISHLLYRLRL